MNDAGTTTTSLNKQLEPLLRERFHVREEVFEHAGMSLRIILPRAADELLDEEAFEKDERMPYWAELWPSAKALARWLLDQPGFAPGMRVIELGCGVGLPSLTLQSRGVNVLASDYNDDALLFARANAHRNGLGELNTVMLDWRQPKAELGVFDLVLAADVLYEQRNALMLAELLPYIMAPGGRFVLADPGRRHLLHFQEIMQRDGWQEMQLAELPEIQQLSTGPATSRIRVAAYEKAHKSK